MIGSQTDIAATILNQLNMKHDRYEWSNNLLNKNRNNYAFYNFKTDSGGAVMVRQSRLIMFQRK